MKLEPARASLGGRKRPTRANRTLGPWGACTPDWLEQDYCSRSFSARATVDKIVTMRLSLCVYRSVVIIMP